jgi:hypothetical protein
MKKFILSLFNLTLYGVCFLLIGFAVLFVTDDYRFGFLKYMAALAEVVSVIFLLPLLSRLFGRFPNLNMYHKVYFRYPIAFLFFILGFSLYGFSLSRYQDWKENKAALKNAFGHFLQTNDLVSASIFLKQ